jgi:hypothetical protein
VLNFHYVRSNTGEAIKCKPDTATVIFSPKRLTTNYLNFQCTTSEHKIEIDLEADLHRDLYTGYGKDGKYYEVKFCNDFTGYAPDGKFYKLSSRKIITVMILSSDCDIIQMSTENLCLLQHL